MTAPEKTRRSKRSRVAPIAVLGAAAFALSACQEEKVETQVFPNKESCLEATTDANSWWTAEECEKAFAEAQRAHAEGAPRYAEQKLCEEQHGGACYVEQRSDGSSIFLPLMAGYMIGNMMGNSSASARSYTPQPIYKTKDNKYSTVSGSAIMSSNRSSGSVRATSFQRPTSTYSKPAMTRATVSKSGGFGASRTSSSRSFGG